MKIKKGKGFRQSLVLVLGACTVSHYSYITPQSKVGKKCSVSGSSQHSTDLTKVNAMAVHLIDTVSRGK